MESDTLYTQEPFVDLIETKAHLSQNISNLNEEIEIIKGKINLIKNDKLDIENSNSELVMKLSKLELSLYQLNLDISYLLERNKNLNNVFDKNSDDLISKHTDLSFFEKEMMLIRQSMESAMSFYTDDSLRMELMKKTNSIRDLRVELTGVESEYKDLEKMIEERKREKERQKQLELERQRQEEERLKKLEEEKVLSERTQRNESFKEQKLAPLSETGSFQPFLSHLPPLFGKSFNCFSNNTSVIKQPNRDQSTDNEQSILPGSDKKNKSDKSTKGFYSSSPIKEKHSFGSQFLRW